MTSPLDRSQESILTEEAEVLERGSRYNRTMVNTMEGDGNCFYYSVSDQLYQSPSEYKEMRALVVAEMEKNPDAYAIFCPEQPIAKRIAKTKKNKSWADELEVAAMAAALNMKILVINPENEVLHGSLNTEGIIRVVFDGKVHYNSFHSFMAQTDIEVGTPVVPVEEEALGCDVMYSILGNVFEQVA